MPRTTTPDRLTEIIEAATRVFGRLGYRRTQVANIAAEAGVSQGTIYTYVRSKEALFHLVFVRAFGELETDVVLPVATPAPGETVAVIARGMKTAASVPELRGALGREEPGDVRAELTTIVEQYYDFVEALWPVLAVVERSAADLPELETLYFGKGRPSLAGQLRRYIEQRAASGHFRSVTDASVAARIVIETTVWFAWHRHEDRDSIAYDDVRSRATVVEFICDALIARGVRGL